MNLITLENINKSYSEKILLDNVTFSINEGDKIGLIGVNGAGKSTLLQIVTGGDEFFEGSISTAKNLRIEYLSQNTPYDSEVTVLEQIFKGETPEMKLLMEYEEVLEKVSSDIATEEEHQNLIKLQEKIDSLNLWSLESDAKSILNKLGISNYNDKMGTLSGGQRKRVFLASALITPCELLVLDEPTNHLDSDSIEWLENYLNTGKRALLLITHDRYFLDRVTNRILEIDRGNLYSYSGNYTYYLEKKSERLQLEEAINDKREKLIQKELKWVRRGAKARTTKQKARLQRFDDLVNTEYIKRKEDIEISLIGTRLGKKTIEISDLNKSYDDKVLIRDFSYIFLRDDRIGIVGNNGMGKTTLINIIKGSVVADSGNIEIGDTVKIGVFSQDDTDLPLSERAIDYIREGGEWIPTSDGLKISASQLAERFQFDGTMQYTPIEKLSGGERRRLHLLRILMESPNFLILDEPTNDLDIQTLNILEDFLDEYAGIVVVVSHDRYFLDRICNKIFAYEGNGVIREYTGNYSDYTLNMEINSISDKETSSEGKKSQVKQREKRKDERPKFTFKEQKEYDEIDSVIEKLEGKIVEINGAMDKNASNYGKLNELVKEKEETEGKLEAAMERWEYLNEIAERIEEYNNNKNQ